MNIVSLQNCINLVLSILQAALPEGGARIAKAFLKVVK